MKKLIHSVALLLALFAAPGCNFLDYDLNTDPNKPADVAMKQLLPTTQVSLAYYQGGDLGRYLACWTQYHSGFDRQHLAIEVYQITESDVNNYWGGMYATTLSDTKALLDKAAETNSPHYAGVARVMWALAFSHLVDVYNDIPYSDALQGERAIQPKFDNAANIYNDLIAQLDQAVTDLSAASSTLKPGSDDLIFGGNLGKWTKMAHSLKARLQLHRAKIDPSAYDNVLASLAAGGMSSNADNAMVKFGSDATAANPWYQFEDQRGDVCMGFYFLDLMNSLNDPRRAAFATETASGYVGARAGVSSEGPSASRFGPFYGSANSPIPFLLYPEVKFMEAEAAFKKGNLAVAAAAHNEGVKASLAMFSVSDAAYETANASETDATITLEKIMTQKYIALYTMPETFNDWRRTGLPNLQPAAGQSKIARRWPVAQDERVYNNANYQPYSGVTAFDRVFWDN